MTHLSPLQTIFPSAPTGVAQHPVVPPLAPPTQPPRLGMVSALLQQDNLQVRTGLIGSLQSPLSLFGNLTRSVQPAPPAMNFLDLKQLVSVNALKTMTPLQLKQLGDKDPKAFFKALLPGALESEKKFGVPAAVTLAQAALESGWAESPIGGFNIFGIKGKGPAGTVSVRTTEFIKGRYVKINDNFAKYNNFYEAIKEHGKLFHNGYYNKAVNQYAKDKSTYAFINNIQGIYATDPNYSKKIKSLIEDHGLMQMVQQSTAVV